MSIGISRLSASSPSEVRFLDEIEHLKEQCQEGLASAECTDRIIDIATSTISRPLINRGLQKIREIALISVDGEPHCSKELQKLSKKLIIIGLQSKERETPFSGFFPFLENKLELINFLIDFATSPENVNLIFENLESFSLEEHKIEKEEQREQIMQAKLSLAKRCMKMGRHDTRKIIEKFGFRNEKDRFELARFCTENGWAKWVALYINTFGIRNEKARLELAKLCVENGEAWTVAQYLDRSFRIRSEEDRFELARLCLKESKSAKIILSNLASFEIRDEGNRLELARLCIEKRCSSTEEVEISELIRKFGFWEYRDRFELAKLCAESYKTVNELIFNIKKFEIIEEKDRFELAKLCAENSRGDGPLLLIYNIGRFEISDEKDRCKLAKLCAKNGEAGRVIRHINSFEIKEEANLRTLAWPCINYLMQDYLGERQSVRHFVASMQTPIVSACLQEVQLSCNLPKALHNKFVSALAILLEGDLYTTDPNILARAYRTILLIGMVSLHSKESGEDETLKNWFQILLPKALNIRERISFEVVMQAMLQLFKSPDIQTNYGKLLAKIGQANYLLPVIVSLASISSKVEEVVFEDSLQEIIKIMHDKGRGIKDSQTGVEVNILHLLEHINTLPSDPTSKWNFIIKQIFSVQEDIQRIQNKGKRIKAFKEHLAALQVFFLYEYFSSYYCNVDENTKLLQKLSECSLEDLSLRAKDYLLKNLFSEERLEKLENSEDLYEMYQQRIVEREDKRYPFAIEIFAKSLRTLEDPELNKSIETIILKILRGEFQEYRYDSSRSEHLKKMQKEHPEIWERWKEIGSAAAFESQEAVGSSSRELAEGEKSRLWLEEKLIHDKHLDLTLYPLLEAFLQSESFDKIESSETDKKMVEVCQKLCESDISREKTLELLQELGNIVSQEPTLSQSQWERDINDQMQLLRSEGQLHGNFKIKITHDWLNFLLSGTKVLGSCQSIEGSPDLNKCLPGYMGDGKVQMVAAFDDKGEIVARAMLKLLFQEDGKPALFFERAYSRGPPLEEALKKVALKRAKELGVDLYVFAQGEGSHTLRSYGSTEPYEYEDGGVGISRGGYYSVSAQLDKSGE